MTETANRETRKRLLIVDDLEGMMRAIVNPAMREEASQAIFDSHELLRSALLDAQAALADARAECEELQRHRTVHVDENRSLRATVAELRAALADAKKRIERFETYCETPHCAIIMRHEGPCVLTEAGYALLEHAAFEACADAQREAERLRADAKERRCISCGQELPVPPTRCDGCLEKRLHELIVELGDSHSAFAALHSELRASDRQRREPAEEAGPSGAKPI